MKKTDIPFFSERKQLFKFLKENKDILIAEKKFEPKHGDGISFNQVLYDAKGQVIKSINNKPIDPTSIDVIKTKLAINSTNILDSHGDVHIPGLWKKSLSENKLIKHLQEHQMKFDHIIADKGDLEVYTKDYTWKELGYDFKGSTQILVFESTIRKSRNPYMFDQYAKGYVDNHSVGMQYVTIVMCINSDDEYYGAEYEAWQKYIEMVVNREVAEEKGYFWAIKEAKVFEGSAVPIGSNYVTPTIENNMKNEPGNHSEQPLKSTGINYEFLLNKLTI